MDVGMRREHLGGEMEREMGAFLILHLHCCPVFLPEMPASHPSYNELNI